MLNLVNRDFPVLESTFTGCSKFGTTKLRFPYNKHILGKQYVRLACVTQRRRQRMAKRQVMVAEIDSKQIGNGGQASILHASNASSNG